MKNFDRNNLDKALSPYLLQHKDNPIHWQEWSPDIIPYAQTHDKLIFLSTGYSTCHWCHEMARDSFNDPEAAQFLNNHFVAINIDREQRPDIDQYATFFSVESQGAAGWPLNVILTPDFKPFLAFTYVPSIEQQGLPSFLKVLEQSMQFYKANKEKIAPYKLPVINPPDIPEPTLLPLIEQQYDSLHGGFGASPKFPPHATLLFLLTLFEHTHHQHAYAMVKKTLDAMALKGLHDHVQGGFFRYCADDAWEIPHFEKMLYDQGLLLWIYSAAHKILKEPHYATIASYIIKCLTDSFKEGDVYYSALNAETEGKEGHTYIWDKQELTSAFTPTELETFNHLFTLREGKKINDKYHLTKSRFSFDPAIEQKLLSVRSKRSQPQLDKKIITSWNALTGIGLCMAYRYGIDETGLAKSEQLFKELWRRNKYNDTLAHSSFNAVAQPQVFLEDYASMLLLVTYVHEDTQNYETEMTELYNAMGTFFQEGTWFTAFNTDFMDIPAQLFDHALPSDNSLAYYALWRAAFFLDRDIKVVPTSYKQPLNFDFFNLTVRAALGNIHLIETPDPISWDSLPYNAMQKKGATLKHCFNNVCTTYDAPEALLNALMK